jgi:hopanoid biosynthesis associated protein HpnK
LRRLIINADDFGYTRGVNRAIAECVRTGTVTSTTLMACSQAFDDAVAIAAADGLNVGCHVMLVDGTPLLPADQLRTLTNDGEFISSATEFARVALIGGVAEGEVHAEATAQFKKLRASGVEITHFDTHKHAHMFPVVSRPLLTAAKEMGIHAVRNPFEPFSIHWITSPGLWVRGAQTASLLHFRSEFAQAVAEAGLKTTDGTLGIAVTGRLDSTWLRRIVQGLPDGSWELVCHPGYIDEELANANTRLQDSRETERQALTSAEFRRLLKEEKIDLISYADL